MSKLKNKTVLVTGGAGFIGSHIVDELISRKAKVVIVDNLSTGKKANINREAIFFQGDTSDLRFLNKISQKIMKLSKKIHGTAEQKSALCWIQKTRIL